MIDELNQERDQQTYHKYIIKQIRRDLEMIRLRIPSLPDCIKKEIVAIKTDELEIIMEAFDNEVHI